jgi:hypothetical protein
LAFMAWPLAVIKPEGQPDDGFSSKHQSPLA